MTGASGKDMARSGLQAALQRIAAGKCISDRHRLCGLRLLALAALGLLLVVGEDLLVGVGG